MVTRIEGKTTTVVRSLSAVGEVGIDLFTLLGEKPDGNSRITELQLAYDASPDRAELALLANRAFGSNLLPFQIHTRGSFEDRDHLFAARGFGDPYKIIPHFARLRRRTGSLPDEQTIEAWASPVLVPRDHFLAKKGEGTAVILFREPLIVTHHQPRVTVASLDFFSGMTPAQYLRVTLAVGFDSLAEVAQAFGSQGVNIYEMWQPEVEAGKDIEIAFILEPCLTVRFRQAMDRVKGLLVCRAVNTILPVIGARLRTPRETLEL